MYNVFVIICISLRSKRRREIFFKKITILQDVQLCGKVIWRPYPIQRKLAVFVIISILSTHMFLGHKFFFHNYFHFILDKTSTKFIIFTLHLQSVKFSEILGNWNLKNKFSSYDAVSIFGETKYTFLWSESLCHKIFSFLHLFYHHIY